MENSKNCPNGYYLNSETQICEDINECAFDAPCQYQCENSLGLYKCVCPSGYILNEFGQCSGKYF